MLRLKLSACALLIALIGLVGCSNNAKPAKPAGKSFTQLKQELQDECDKFVAVVSTAEYKKFADEFDSALKSAKETSANYAAAKTAGKDEATLSNLTTRYADNLKRLRKCGDEMYKRIDPNRLAIQKAMFEAALTDGLTKAQAEELISLPEPLTKHFEPFDNARVLIQPVVALSEKRLHEREAAGEKVTDDMRAEEQRKACRVVLDQEINKIKSR